MIYWLPWMLLALFVALLIAMPWRRPHPNHCFILNLLETAIGQHEDAANVLGSKRAEKRLT
jgi:hypothetical protein